MTTQQEKAAFLQNFHQQGASLLLPNAWDVASARLFEEAGFPIIGTTSAGIAFAHGYVDGQQISRDEMLHILTPLIASVQVPVTVDIEAGYGPTPEDVAKTIQGVIAAGAVGVNLEDNTGGFPLLYSPQVQAERIAAARLVAEHANLALFINARIDTYIFMVGEEATRLEDTLQRASIYLEAGANGIFVPGVIDPSIIHVLVQEIPAPLNVMVMPGAPSVPELFKLGVARVSIGGAAMFATMGLVRDIARELREHGTYNHLARHPYGFAEACKLFAKSNAS